MSRQIKTPRQRAEEQLAVTERLVKTLGDQKTRLSGRLEQVTAKHDAAVVRRDWLKQHPDLQQPTTKSGVARSPVAPRSSS